MIEQRFKISCPPTISNAHSEQQEPYRHRSGTEPLGKAYQSLKDRDSFVLFHVAVTA